MKKNCVCARGHVCVRKWKAGFKMYMEMQKPRITKTILKNKVEKT